MTKQATKFENDFPRIRVSDLTPSQRRALLRVVRYLRDSSSYTGVDSVRFDLHAGFAGRVMFKAWTRRSDCDRYSPRQVLCKQDAFGTIGKRGKIEICLASIGTMDATAHVQYMVR